jgi:hypothetical protein
MGEFSEYLWALAGYGKWLLTGGPFLVENIIKRVKPSWIQWLDKKISAAIRLRFEIAIILIAVFVAGFLAWRDEHLARAALESGPTKGPVYSNNPDGIYQFDRMVGIAVGVKEMPTVSKIYFEEIHDTVNLDRNNFFRYRQYSLRIASIGSSSMFGVSITGSPSQGILSNVQATILDPTGK